MINTDKPATWTVYTVEDLADGGGWNIVGTKWTPEEGPTTSKVVNRYRSADTTRAFVEGRAAELQRGYDSIRRAALSA